MGSNNCRTDLLSEIAENLGVCCLSDIRAIEDGNQIQMAILKIPAEKYSISEWINAAGYIGGGYQIKYNKFSTSEAARDYLLQNI